MSTTVLEALQNAKVNFDISRRIPVGFEIAMSQLENAIEALSNGLGADDVIQENMFGEVSTGGEHD